MDAGVNNSLGFAPQNPQLKNGMDAILEQRSAQHKKPCILIRHRKTARIVLLLLLQ
jgi:hypothetical protein